MRPLLFHTTLAAALAASAISAQSPNSWPPRYAVKDLGPVGRPPAQPFVIKNNGLISGAAEAAASVWRAVLWYKGSRLAIGLPGLGGPSSVAFGVNESG